MDDLQEIVGGSLKVAVGELVDWVGAHKKDLFMETQDGRDLIEYISGIIENSTLLSLKNLVVKMQDIEMNFMAKEEEG